MSSLPLLLILAVFMAFTFRQQKAQKAKAAAMSAGMVEGAEVVTNGGIFGFVSAIEDNVVWLEIADGVEIRVAKQMIVRVVDPAPNAVGSETTEETTSETVEAESVAADDSPETPQINDGKDN